MGRRKKADQDKAESTTFSLSPKHKYMLDVCLQITGTKKSEFIQKCIEDFYNTNCKQENIDV